MIVDYALDKALDWIKEIIDIEEFDNSKILIGIDDILPNDMILMTSVIKDNGKFHLQLFLEEASMNKDGNNMWWKNYVRKNIGL